MTASKAYVEPGILVGLSTLLLFLQGSEVRCVRPPTIRPSDYQVPTTINPTTKPTWHKNNCPFGTRRKAIRGESWPVQPVSLLRRLCTHSLTPRKYILIEKALQFHEQSSSLLVKVCERRKTRSGKSCPSRVWLKSKTTLGILDTIRFPI